MKLMLRPEWRLWPLSSFLGVLDLKTGVTVASLFALLNKVAGIYGLIAVITGAGGSFAQLSLYIYSAASLFALFWGLKAVNREDPQHTLYFAHLFFVDHVLSTVWTAFFAVVWWLYTPHDGRRQANSPAQEEMMKGGPGDSGMSPEERAQAAMMIWNKEKGTAAFVITLSWLSKIYFAALLYSYAMHLRKGSYRALPLSRAAPAAGATAISVNGNAPYDSALGDDDDDADDFYRMPVRAPHSGSGSISGFADFVSAPGGPGRRRGGDDVLFDEDESTVVGHSKQGTEEGPSKDAAGTSSGRTRRGTGP